ncbi:4-alpha-glucanotransferase [Jiella sp. MQZ9-1]|uniref:4-alpha-glucanotransferase n=1 Tax=Jiella flava TaxID=2816857 RepID=A0A939JUT4_9HYPH|nr:4-alpha-glucanotransferase [Jiella flava]MBO0661297.1 4-alpha-glucanotransferase [Jiella flava]MCD2469942.1 4-alpha-glucanotransferase [Jiella flava]
MSDHLDRLAESHGIQLHYISELGEEKSIDDGAKRALLAALGVDPDGEALGDYATSAKAPSQACPLPGALADHRHWGVACQLYALTSTRNLGIGDFEDLARLASIAAEAGAAFVGVNPLHALFLAEPSRYSPYSPSTRRFLNPLYLAVDKMDGGPEAIAALQREAPDLLETGDGDLVDYSAVGRLKRALFDKIFETRKRDLEDEQAFQRFIDAGGEAVAGFALFEAISEDQVATGGHAGWHGWPEALKDRRSETVAQFAADNRERVLFHLWLQFEAEEQLASAQARAKGAGMAIGLYLDLAVGVAPDGAETWADPALTVGAARVGSPPDMFNSQGQDWGLAPLSPKALAERDHKPLFEAFSALTRHAGAVRIDHAMGLARLWWIPNAARSAGGGYVRYQFGAMVDAVASAASDNHCLVIGEDLGTVPPGFRDAMAAANVLSYRVLSFERRDDGSFIEPAAYPPLSLACVSTHDLATLAGWWTGNDITLRFAAGTQDEAATERDRHSREHEKWMLVQALVMSGTLPDGFAAVARGEAPMPGTLPDVLAVAIHRHLARSASLLLTVQLDDMIGSSRQANLPGTTDQYPNWRIKAPVMLEDLSQNGRFTALAAAMREERPIAP